MRMQILLAAFLVGVGLFSISAAAQTDTPTKPMNGSELGSSPLPSSSPEGKPIRRVVQEDPASSGAGGSSTLEIEVGLVGGAALIPDPDGWICPATLGLDSRFTWIVARHMRLGFRIGLVAGFDQRRFRLEGGSIPTTLVMGFELGARWSLDLSVGVSLWRPLVGLGLAADVWRGSGIGIRLRLLFDYLPAPTPRPTSGNGSGGGIGVVHFMFPQASVLVTF